MSSRVLRAVAVAAVAVACCVSSGALAEESYKSEMGIINSKGRVFLDPSVQHIPLNPTKTQLRPPPPRVPERFDMFVGLSVFRDGYRCAKTIFTGLKRAKNRDRIFFGVVDQVNPGDDRCVFEYCKMAAEEWPELGECPYRDQLRFDEHLADDSRGPTLARHYQQKLLRNEEFCLQLDGHSIFTNNWDVALLAEWKRVNNEMAVLSTYLHHIHDFVKENGDNKPPNSYPHLCTTIRGANGCVRNEGASMISGSKFPQLSALWGAGLSFSKCHAERRVPIDSHTLWMFDGEEFLRASHLWTNGYDMYSPSELGSVVYHNYSKVPARFENVKVDQKQKKVETEMGINRFNLIVGKPFKGNVDTFEMDVYKFGNVRTFQEYLQFSGVTFEEGKNDTDSCKQLHWVPYSNPKEVEEIVGGGWTLYPKTEKPKVIDPPIPQVRDGKNPTVTDEPEDATAQHAADAHADTGAGGGEPILNPKFRQEMADKLTQGASSGSVWLFLFIIAVMLFVMISNDGVSRGIRRSFRMKTSASSK
ncbi:Glcnac transferase, partial [Globisporangium splendens]